MKGPTEAALIALSIFSLFTKFLSFVSFIYFKKILKKSQDLLE
jgi:hypothetical protein